MHIDLERSVIRKSRENYDFLEWIGDIGGLIDGLFLMGHIAIYPVANNKLYKQLYFPDTSVDSLRSWENTEATGQRRTTEIRQAATGGHGRPRGTGAPPKSGR